MSSPMFGAKPMSGPIDRARAGRGLHHRRGHRHPRRLAAGHSRHLSRSVHRHALAAEGVRLADPPLSWASEDPSATSSTYTMVSPVGERLGVQLARGRLVDHVADLGVVVRAVDHAGLHDHDRRALRDALDRPPCGRRNFVSS